MFFYNEYNNSLVNVHFNEKVRFYNFKNLCSLKTIIILIKYIRIKYKIIFKRYSNLMFISTKFAFYSYFNVPIKYLNRGRYNYRCFSFVSLNRLLCKYNVFYYFFISFFFEEFKKNKCVDYNESKSLYRTLTLRFYTLINSPLHDMFYHLKKFYSYVNIRFKTNSNNLFFNKIWLSHIFLNI